MRLSFCIIFILCSVFSRAQSYQSLFSGTNNKWNTAYLGIDFSKTDTVYVQKDTVVNSVLWKKLSAAGSLPPVYSGGLMREDTLNGKVWYKALTGDTATKLVFDYSLSKGDTFNINSSWKSYSTLEKTVDTTYIRNGRKYIEFKGTAGNMGQPGERFTFIEGIGSNVGLLYKSNHANTMMHYLLCAFKNGVQTYANLSFQGVCYLQTTALRGVNITRGINVYPTVFANQLKIENKSTSRLTSIVIINLSGQTVYTSRYQPAIFVPELPAGIYFLSLYDNQARVFNKMILRR